MIGTKLAPNRMEANKIGQLVRAALDAGKRPDPEGIAKIMNIHLESVTAWVEYYAGPEGKAPKVSGKGAKEGKVPVK